MSISVMRDGERSPGTGEPISPDLSSTNNNNDGVNIKMKTCPICHKRMQLRSIRRHARRVHQVRLILNNDEIEATKVDDEDINAIVRNL